MASTPTSKRYLDDSYRTEFTANVIACDPDEHGFAVILDETYFYPESGGQLSDRGTIAGVEIVDVREIDGDRVAHIVVSEVAVASAQCKIDWRRRFDHMQHHTGQHVLSRAFIEVAGLETVSFHMGDDTCTIDLSGGKLNDDVAGAAEALSNQIVFENRPVHIRNVTADDLDSEALRRKLPVGVSEVRLIDVDNFDVCGCCGTHVRHTGELGLIKVLKSEKAKGAERVSFKVGRRALADFQDKHDIVKALSNRFTTGSDAILDKIDKLQSEAQEQRKENKRLLQRLAELEAVSLADAAVETAGCRLVVRVYEDASDEYIRALGGILKSVERTVSLLANAAGTVVCHAAAGTEVDFQTTVVEPAKVLGGSGGGKGGFVTVRLPQGADVAGFIDTVRRAVGGPE